ncbi:bifunctional adenosylcobinamide kinase/adenosylcobinamide-phosphate guanylyltransferase [Mycolicibacterium sp. ELW1]|uniref:bifunctional adenosylcobinamide kinase/adenosylcobinamide-phosphate guanylyltransferase n=1 Tax=Mycobacteriaceae TaxID=1762 RepID=UPI0011EF347C|nr:bifunctional adenosylcobinamide kinase/adenosylcobinamide-phosphate guanylyltransferase [Mycobacterium sp. ELW1]QEN17157.1 bifunctional adenosylcobinamide kinase/adenosylcobinamide-phosphate guanylyltransferase [Mycobacterium sp. ELW1]
MRTLVLGGIRSGKSRWAETALVDESVVRYVATGVTVDSDPSWARRVAVHRERRPESWHTVETADVATVLRDDPATATLVDDLGSWLTATLDRRGWDGGSVTSDVDELVGAVETFTGPLALVSPEVGLTVVAATASGRRFTDELGTLNQRLALCCEQVVLVVAGLPVWVKPTKALS